MPIEEICPFGLRCFLTDCKYLLTAITVYIIFHKQYFHPLRYSVYQAENSAYYYGVIKMSVAFFFISIAAAWTILGIVLRFRSLELPHIIIAIATTAYTLVYETILGIHQGLYYYINPETSAFYIVLAAVLLYPLVNIIYVLFLPVGRNAVLIYTGAWIAGMLVLEYASVMARTIVFTGWQPIPWSLVTYLVTYSWIYYFYMYLTRKVRIVQ